MTESFLTPGDVSRLTPWARVAFAARCARRIQPFFAKEEVESPQESLEAVDKAILVAERLAGNEEVTSQHYGPARDINAIPSTARSVRAAYAAAAALYCTQAADAAADYVGMFRQTLYDETITKCALSAAWSAALAVASPHDASFQDFRPVSIFRAPEDVQRIASYAPRSAARLQRFGRALERDFALLKDAANREAWQIDTPVSTHFFSLRSAFDVETPIDKHTILDISSEIDAKLVEYFLRHPDHLYSLVPRRFEELIAELFAGFGFDVELTQKTRDGGKDVIAVRHSPANLKYLIECKRYAPDRSVGVTVVRELLGVLVIEHATKGIVATTSQFTRDATAAMENVPWLIEGRDFDGVVQWLDQYQAFQMAKIRDEE